MKSARLLACALAAAAVACGGPASEGEGVDEPARVVVGLRPYLTNAPLYIAREEGYFDRAGLDVRLQNMPSSTSQSVPALDRGEIDVIAGSVSIGLLNAMGEGRGIRIVADKGHFAAEVCSPSALVVRGSLRPPGGIGPGEWLRGRRVAFTSANHDGFYVDRLLRRAGLTMEDVREVTVPLPVLGEALDRGSVDLTAVSEPWLTRLLEAGHRVVAPANEMVPELQYGVLVFGPSLLEERPDVGKRFLTAYLGGVLRYNEGKTLRNLEILSGWTGLDRATLERVCWPSIRDDGRVGVETVVEFQRWARTRGHLSRVLEPELFHDPAPLEGALAAPP